MPNQNNLENLNSNLSDSVTENVAPESSSEIETLGSSEEPLSNKEKETDSLTSDSSSSSAIVFSNAQDLYGATGSVPTVDAENLDNVKGLVQEDQLVSSNNAPSSLEENNQMVSEDTTSPNDSIPKVEVLSDEFGNEVLGPEPPVASAKPSDETLEDMQKETCTIFSNSTQNFLVSYIFATEKNNPLIDSQRIITGLNYREPLKSSTNEAIYHYNFQLDTLAIPISKTSNLIYVMDNNEENRQNILTALSNQQIDDTSSSESEPVIVESEEPDVVIAEKSSVENKEDEPANPDYQSLINEIYQILVTKYQVDGALTRLHNYLETKNPKSITRYQNAREKISEIPFEKITDFLNQKEKYRQTIQEVIDTMDVKYGSGTGLTNLSKYLESGKTALITSTNNARQKISKVPKTEIAEFVGSKTYSLTTEA